MKGRFEDFYFKRVGTGAEITCLAWDEHSGETIRIATGTRDGLIQGWLFTSKVRLDSPFSVQLKTKPITIGFSESRAKDVYVFGREDGNVYACFLSHQASTDFVFLW
jgi:WD40 repeat protein